MTAPCQCSRCILGRLHGISGLMARGRAGMAAMALGTVVNELEKHVTAGGSQSRAPTRKATLTRTASRHRAPATETASARRAAKLGSLLHQRPELRKTVAAALKVRRADVDAIVTGRVQLTNQQWKRLWLALEEP